MSEATPLLHASSGSPGAPPAQARRRSKAKRALKTEDPAEPRRRGHGGGNNPHESDDDDNDDDDDDELSDRDGGSESEESPLRRSFRYLKPALENAPRVIHPLGEATRKPRWTGIRSKVTAVAGSRFSGPPLEPTRANGRRGRFRSSDYDERLAMTEARSKPPTDAQTGRVAAYCTSDQIGLFKLLKWLDRLVRETPGDGKPRQPQVSGWENKMYMGVLHSSSKPQSSDSPNRAKMLQLAQKHAFYFATGCCVFWGFEREEELLHLQALAPFATGTVLQTEAEDMEYCFGEASRIANDAIVLSSNAVAEKLAISFAMAQSAKLDVFEERVDDRIRNTKHIPSNLATTGSIQYSQADISKLIGQLFIELADVNLHSDILDEPDFFWEDDEYEPLYKRTLKYLDVANRVKILNKRLDILRELVEVLNQELTQQHGAKLEWIIIWLLVIEIVISVGWDILLKDILGLFRHN